MRTLLLGGARSGKSRHAEQLARQSGLAVTYIATAEAGDAEMAARIALHRSRRQADWACIESPLRLGETLNGLSRTNTCVIVDCLTLWLSNVFHAGKPGGDDAAERVADGPFFAAEMQAFLDAIAHFEGQLLLVSNEVGCGIVPMNALARRFADEQGRLDQRVAAACDRVTLLAAGLPLALK